MVRIYQPVDLASAEAEAARPRGLRPALGLPYGTAGSLLGVHNQFGPQPLQNVTETQVMGLPSAWYCLNKIASGVASMWPLDVKAGDGVTALPRPNICARPDSTMSLESFVTMAVACAVARGNYIGIRADLDPTTYFPRQVISAPPDICTAFYDADGYLWYTVGGKLYHPDDIVHVPGLTLPGNPWGFGVVEVFRRGLGAALEQQHLSADTYHRGSVPPGILTVPRPRLAPGEAKDVQGQWIDAHGQGQRVPAVIAQGWKFEPIAWSPEDSQFLQAQAFTVAQMAFMFGFDPADLAASIGTGGANLTYANIEQREQGRIIDVYGPWSRRFEQAWSDMLPADQFAHAVPENRLRMDSETRAKVDETDIGSGVIDVDEARRARRLPPLTAAQKKAREPVAPGAPVVPPQPEDSPLEVKPLSVKQ